MIHQNGFTQLNYERNGQAAKGERQREKSSKRFLLTVYHYVHMHFYNTFFNHADQQAAYEKMKQAEKKHLAEFRIKIETMVNDLIKDDAKQKIVFETMDKVHRAVV